MFNNLIKYNNNKHTNTNINLMQAYPLYDELLAKVNSRASSSIDIKRLSTTINKIAQTCNREEAEEHYTEIAALILHHQTLSEKQITYNIPYGGKPMFNDKGILYVITNLPPILQQIIAEYIHMNAKN